MRWVLIAALPAVALVTGCDSAQSVAARTGVMGFEARCEASLPETRIQVVTKPVTYATDRTHSWRELTAMGVDTEPAQRAIGLTTAKLGDKVTLETSGVEEQQAGRVCVRPSMTVELSATPMTVYIAREIAADRCREAAALEHELKHVAVYREELAHVATDVRAALRAAYGNRVLYYRNRAEARRQTEAAIEAELAPLLDRIAARIKTRQRAIDSPEEYSRVSGACGGMLVE